MSIQSRSHQYGTVFENWQILELLGQGSGGKTAVFRLKRIDSNRGQSALKVINLIEERGNWDTVPVHLRKEYEAARDECKNSALQEVWLMDDFQGNTNIVDYLDHKFVEWTDETGFGCDMLIRMELLKDLRSEIRSGKTFSESDIIKIGCDICQALILCHGNGILHRDIKPENIFVNRNRCYKLGDFGISRIISNAPMSMASTGIGTPEYAAPEQTSGKYDIRVDIYSLGLVLYELSNHNRLPFSQSSYIRPDAVHSRMAGVPLSAPENATEKLAEIILKACAFKPEHRYQTAREMLKALQTLHKEAVTTQQWQSTPKNEPVSVGYETVPAAAFKGNTDAYTTVPAFCDSSGQKGTPASASDDTPQKATAEDAEEQNEMGNRYYNGDGVPQDFAKAAEYYQKAAVQGHVWGQYSYGFCLCYGKGVKQNYAEAVTWYTKAAEQGNPWAQNELGNCYYSGHGVEQDYTKAVHYFQKAANQEDASGQYNLGRCYYHGHGVDQDYRTATEYYTAAAEKGHILALRYLAFCYDSSGLGVKHDAKKAFELYQKAAEAGDTRSMLKMADYYAYGQYVKEDTQKSEEWCDRAIQLGDDEAMCRKAAHIKPLLSSCLRSPSCSVLGIEERYKKAIHLYKLAAERNNEQAVTALDKIRKELISERKQGLANYRNMAARLLDEFWPRAKS